MGETITNRFISVMINLLAENVGDAVKREVKLCFADYVACAFIGSKLLNNQVDKYVSSFSDYSGCVPVIGMGKKANSLVAAMANGFLVHYAELDDGQRYAMLHLGAPIFSALLSVACEKNLGYEDFERGVLIGYETAIRLASAIQPGHKLKGYHATGTCGTIGAALGIASALKYDFNQWQSTISASTTDASGLLQMIDDGSELKPYNIGRAAVAAINSAYMGGTGFRGPSDVLGGKRGFFSVAADGIDESYLIEGFMPLYAIETIYRKPYAACRHCHSAIEATLNIRKEQAVEVKQIESVLVKTYGLAVKGHEHNIAINAGNAKMSIPYSIATALVYGSVNVEQYEDDCLNNDIIKKLMQKVTVIEDQELSKTVPKKRSAIVYVKMNNGCVYKNKVDYPLGEPENKMSQEQFEEKFNSLVVASGVSASKCKTLLDMIYGAEVNFKKILTMLAEG